MKKMDVQPRIRRRRTRIPKPDEKKKDFPGYEPYPSDEDIYAKDKQETAIDPEAISGQKTFPRTGMPSESQYDYDTDVSDEDLDIPGADLDDDMESIGSEDEENDYYSVTDNNYDELEDILER